MHNVLGLNIKRGGTYSKHWAPERKHKFQPPFAQCVFANKTHGYAIFRYASRNDADTF
jgi:hypothetical protein